MVNASIKLVSGSGLNEQYVVNCLFNFEANKSISGLKLRALLNIAELIFHSVSRGRKDLDSLSAVTLEDPGM